MEEMKEGLKIEYKVDMILLFFLLIYLFFKLVMIFEINCLYVEIVLVFCFELFLI